MSETKPKINQIEGLQEALDSKLSSVDTMFTGTTSVEALMFPDSTTITTKPVGANLGTGVGVYNDTNGNTLRLKSLKAGTNVSISGTSTEITISATGGGGGGSSPFISVKDHGAVGDGVANDATAVAAAITAAKAINASVYFPNGTYLITGLAAQNGRVELFGDGDATILGTFSYTETSFPTSADTLTPLVTTSPRFTAKNLNFRSNTTDYALRVVAQEQPNFITTARIESCKFFGNKGVLGQHLIGFEVINSEFNNVVAGARFEGCVNGTFTNCRWQNQAESGVWITNVSGGTRAGGENLRFVNCEWAVCTYGLVVDQHLWLSMDNCLIDYCANPLFLSGSVWAKVNSSYFGASNTAVSRFSAVSGYLAPVTSGIAVYGRPGGSPVGNRVVGGTFVNCEFINYVSSSSQPIVYFDGFVDGTFPASAEEIGFFNCLFYATQSHTAITLLEISNAKVAHVIGNRFRSFNLSSTLTNAYRLNTVTSSNSHSNDFHHCRQSSVIVSSIYEKNISGVIISASDPGAVGAGTIWVTP